MLDFDGKVVFDYQKQNQSLFYERNVHEYQILIFLLP